MLHVYGAVLARRLAYTYQCQLKVDVPLYHKLVPVT